MPARRKQSFLHGALILTVATVLVKVIGAVFKIPLTLVLGAEGSAHFYTAYDIFNPVAAIAIAGLPVAVSKLVSENAAHGRFRDVRRIRRLSLSLFTITGTLGFAVTFFFARPFASLVGNPSGFVPILAIAPAVLFLCLMSSYRGYYEGLRNMYPTAVSQVVEAMAKLIMGYGLSLWVMKIGLDGFERTGSVFGVPAGSLAAAQTVVLPFAAAGGILGVTLSTVFGFLYLLVRHLRHGDGITKAELATSPSARPKKALLGGLVRIAVPVCLGSLVVSLTATIDLASVMNRLSAAVARDSQTMLTMYAGMIPADMTLARLPAFLFGTYKGLPMTIFHLVPAITTAFGISVLPAVSSAWARRDSAELKRNVESALRVTALVAVPAGLGMTALAGPILSLLYNFSGNGLVGEVAISTPILTLMGVSVIFVAIASPINAILQAVGRADLPVKYMLIGGALKLATNYVLVAIPSVNIMGAPVGTFLCYLFIAVASIISVCKKTHTALDLVSVFLKPLIAGAICAGAAYASYGLLTRVWDTRICTILSIAVAGVVYLFTLFLVRGISKDDLLMLPGGEKIAKVLESHGIIG
ncbi:MAG: polysaccharide biosynthesis C-terminal domain-containing protein [Acetanaerobacterium sp.]